MSGRRAQQQGYTRIFPPGSYTFTVPSTGLWKFILHGAGGVIAADAGASGAYAEKTFPLGAGTLVTVVAGAPSGADTTVSAPGFLTVTAGTASTSTPGTASNGDVMYNGSAGGTAGGNGVAGLGPGGGAAGGGAGGISGGAGAPGTTEFPGGRGRTASQTQETSVSPGGGQAGVSSGSAANAGDGRVVALLLQANG